MTFVQNNNEVKNGISGIAEKALGLVGFSGGREGGAQTFHMIQYHPLFS